MVSDLILWFLAVTQTLVLSYRGASITVKDHPHTAIDLKRVIAVVKLLHLECVLANSML